MAGSIQNVSERCIVWEMGDELDVRTDLQKEELQWKYSDWGFECQGEEFGLHCVQGLS